MPALGLGLAFVGYSVLYYGITQVRGQNFGFLDLVLPSKWTAVRLNQPAPDSSATTGSVAGSSPNLNPDGSLNLADITTPLTGGTDTSTVYNDQVTVNGTTFTLAPDLRQGTIESTGEGGFSDPNAGGGPTDTPATPHPSGWWNYGDASGPTHWGPPGSEPFSVRWPDTPRPGPGWVNDGGVWVRS